jgi:hypothetical protein
LHSIFSAILSSRYRDENPCDRYFSRRNVEDLMLLKNKTVGDYARLLPELLTAVDLDSAIDGAARRASAVVAEFAAAVMSVGLTPAIEFAVEFFVPPMAIEAFAEELDDQLMRLSFGYAAARHRGELGAPVIRLVAPGAFHQWRSAARRMSRAQAEVRWPFARSAGGGASAVFDGVAGDCLKAISICGRNSSLRSPAPSRCVLHPIMVILCC